MNCVSFCKGFCFFLANLSHKFLVLYSIDSFLCFVVDPSLFQGFPDKLSPETHKEEVPSQRVSFVLKRPHTSLLESDKLAMKIRLNHFQKYTDVKPKEEKRPTLIEFANQKDISAKVDAWKLVYLGNHLEEVVSKL